MKSLNSLICRFTITRSCLGLLALTMVLSACSQQEKNTVENSSDATGDTVHAMHESTALLEDTSVPLPLEVVNRPHYHTIEIRQMKFNPQELTVEKGDTLVWVNNGITAHDVTEQPDAKWTSGSMPVGASWEMIANETSDYYCSIHVVMKGKLVVK